MLSIVALQSLSEDFRMVTPPGHPIDKDPLMTAVMSGLDWRTYGIQVACIKTVHANYVCRRKLHLGFADPHSPTHVVDFQPSEFLTTRWI
jgi:hypothetical protein